MHIGFRNRRSDYQKSATYTTPLANRPGFGLLGPGKLYLTPSYQEKKGF
jgi:hypothetical protein